MKNYAGHRLAPWLGHLMISRSETPRPLLTPGEVMQLPPADEIVMVAGVHPIRAKKARYFEDVRFTERILAPPVLKHVTSVMPDDWSTLSLPVRPKIDQSELTNPIADDDDPTESEKRRQPELSSKKAVEKKPMIEDEFGADLDVDDDDNVRARGLTRAMQQVARQARLDPDDGIL
jgi:type IV secretion system protein VirD4